MWCYTGMSRCEFAVCGYEGVLMLVSLFYVGIVLFVIRLKYIPVAAGRLSSYSTYQHEAITSRSLQLLMMGTWLPETC
jgi:hypothetical protein